MWASLAARHWGKGADRKLRVNSPFCSCYLPANPVCQSRKQSPLFIGGVAYHVTLVLAPLCKPFCSILLPPAWRQWEEDIWRRGHEVSSLACVLISCADDDSYSHSLFLPLPGKIKASVLGTATYTTETVVLVPREMLMVCRGKGRRKGRRGDTFLSMQILMNSLDLTILLSL